MASHGVDLSKWNGPVDNGADVAKALREQSGTDRVFGLVNLGNANSERSQQIAALRDAGVDVEGYFYLYPQNDLGAQIAEAVANRDGCTTVWVDVEVTGGMPFSAIAQIAEDALTGLNWHLLESGLYSNRNFLDNMPGAPWGHPLWFADPNAASPDYPGVVIWQNSWTETLPGIAGQVDGDLFLGDVAEYDKLFNVKPEPAPQPDPAPNQGEPTFDLKVRQLKSGDSGAEVLALQGVLVARGYHNLDFTGVFNVYTERAVRDWQQRHALGNDGIAGPDTWASLVHA